MSVLRELDSVHGPNLTLRLVRTDDAEYVHELRTNPAYGLYLSETHGSAEDQRRWIEAYKVREAILRELYYVIERKDGVPCGLVRLYDIGTDSFTWGSWILDHNKTRKAALESAVLSFGVGFHRLGLSQALVDVRIGNEPALSIYQRFGMRELRRDHRNIYFTYPRSLFDSELATYLEVLAKEKA